MRPLVLSLALLVAVPASADGPARPPPPAPGVVVESLPAGLWFRENHYEDHALEDEPEPPRFAAIAGTFSSAAPASRAAVAVDRTRVALGFPWVVANHDLQIAGRCSESVVVVVGLFTREDDARAWRAADRARHRFRIVPLQTEDTRPCAWETNDQGLVEDRAGRRWEVIQIDPAADAPAVPEPGRPSTCRVARGSVHLFSRSDVLYRHGHRYAPVRCGGRVAYVPVERTFRSVVFRRGRDGETRVMQITDVMCDSAHFDTWRYTLEGRVVIPDDPPTFAAGCGGRS